MTSYLPLQQSIDFPYSPFDNTLMGPMNLQGSTVKVMNATTFTENLSDSSIGGLSQVNMPLNHLVKNVVLVMKMKTGAAGLDTINTQQYVPFGWGYDALEWIEYSYGGENVLRVSGDQLRAFHQGQVESGEKKKELFSLAGPEYAGTNPTGKIQGMVVLPLPHSNPNSGRVIPYDMSILNNKPAQITIKTKPAREWITKAVNSAQADPVRFAEIYVAYQQQLLVDGPSDSISSLVQYGGNRKYDYGFIYPQRFVSEPFLGISVADGGRQNVQLNNFLPGSVQSMDLFIERLTYQGTVDPDVATDTNSNLRFSRNTSSYYLPLSNVEVMYGGQSIFRSPDSLSEVFSLCDYPTGTTFDVNVAPYSRDAGTQQATVPLKSHIYHVQLSQYNEQFFNLVQQGARLSNATVNVYFNTPELADLRVEGSRNPANTNNPEVTAQCSYRLHVNYNYQCSLRSAEGMTSMLFTRPERLLPDVNVQ